MLHKSFFPGHHFGLICSPASNRTAQGQGWFVSLVREQIETPRRGDKKPFVLVGDRCLSLVGLGCVGRATSRSDNERYSLAMPFAPLLSMSGGWNIARDHRERASRVTAESPRAAHHSLHGFLRCAHEIRPPRSLAKHLRASLK